jgi:hypothetical protein
MGVKISKIPLIFFIGKKEKKNCKDLGVSKDLTKFVKLAMHESLKKKLLLLFF